MRHRHASERADDVDEGNARQNERPGHKLPGHSTRDAGDNRLAVGNIADHVRLSGALPRVRRPIANRPASTPAARSAVPPRLSAALALATRGLASALKRPCVP